MNTEYAAPHGTTAVAAGRDIRIAPDQIRRVPGSELDIRPGARVHLDFLWSGHTFWAEFVGMRQDCYVLLHPPVEQECLEQCRGDTQATVRYVHRRYHICGFSTWVRKLVMQPAPLLFLAFPRGIEVVNLRRRERAACILPGAITCRNRELSAVIVNLSTEGCRVVLKPGAESGGPLFETGEEVICSFSLPGVAQALTVRGVVRCQGDYVSRIAVGVRFAELEQSQADAVNAFVVDVLGYLPA